MIMKNFYWVGSKFIGIKSTIIPGQWGHLVLSIPNHSSLPLELIYENVRLAKYPDRPSRLNSLFLCPSIESATKFQKENRPSDVIWEVELLDPNLSQFLTDWMIVTQRQDTKLYFRDADNYWKRREVDLQRQELLTESQVRLVKQVDTTTLLRR